MAISVGGYGAEESPMSDINTTPLVDVMLVLLIIFLITIPVVNQTVPLRLPKETNVPREAFRGPGAGVQAILSQRATNPQERAAAADATAGQSL